MSGMKILVQKKNPAGKITYQYEGVMLSREEHSIVLEALFDRADMPFMDVVFKTGDRFVEYYFSNRWYNIFTIRDREDGTVKGWYCNIGEPAVIEDGVVSYVDLALDLWVSTDGTQTVLDEDEVKELGLDADMEQKALTALQELKTYFETKRPPQ